MAQKDVVIIGKMTMRKIDLKLENIEFLLVSIAITITQESEHGMHKDELRQQSFTKNICFESKNNQDKQKGEQKALFF